VQVRIHATATGFRFTQTGTGTVTHSCCALVHQHGWTLWGNALVMLLAIVIPVLAALWRPIAFGAAALGGAALMLLAGPISDIVYLRQHLTPADVGLSAQQATQGSIGVSTHGLPGLWIAIIASVIFAIFAIGHALRIGTSAGAD
jgi:hypothetical protein